MKITKQRLKEIIREELTAEGSREDMMMPAISMADMEAAVADDDAGLGDLQSDEKFTGGSREAQMIRRIKARELLAAMSKEELAALSKSLDAATVAELRHLLANPMYAPRDEGAEELEEKFYGGAYDRSRYAPRKKGEPGEQSANQGSGRPDSATRSANAGARQGGDPSKSPFRRRR